MSHDTDNRDIKEILKSATASTKNSPYYKKEIGSRLKPGVEEAYLKWSGLPKDKLRERLHKIVSEKTCFIFRDTLVWHVIDYYLSLISFSGWYSRLQFISLLPQIQFSTGLLCGIAR